MGYVSNKLPGGASTGTVEEPITATWSYNLSTDISLLAVDRQARHTSHSQPVLVLTSQIRTGEGILFSPTYRPTEGTSRLPTAVIYPPKESAQPILTGTGNRNLYDVTQVSVEQKCYIVTKAKVSPHNQNCAHSHQ